jgi:hypothetical protein
MKDQGGLGSKSGPSVKSSPIVGKSEIMPSCFFEQYSQRTKPGLGIGSQMFYWVIEADLGVCKRAIGNDTT